MPVKFWQNEQQMLVLSWLSNYYACFWRTLRKSLVLKIMYYLYFVNSEILLGCSKNSHRNGRIFRQNKTKIQFLQTTIWKKCYTTQWMHWMWHISIYFQVWIWVGFIQSVRPWQPQEECPCMSRVYKTSQMTLKL